MKFNFRRVASLIGSALMIGSTIGIAAAASYPGPFVAGGTANVGVVVGNSAASSDFLASISLVRSLQKELSAQTSTSTDDTGVSSSGGDSASLATTSRKLYYGDAINSALTALSVAELPDVLADGTVTDLTGTAYDYTQSIVIGATTSVYGNSGGDLDDPILYLDVGTATTAPLYNYTLSFTKNLNVSDATNVQGQTISMLGVDYVIGASSTQTTLYLYGAGNTVTVAGGESVTVDVGGTEHVIELVTTASTTAATISVDGSRRSVTESNKYQFPGEVVVYVKDIVHPAFAGDIREAELIIGANALKIANGATVKSGADEATVKGTLGTLTAGSGDGLSKITVSVAMEKSKIDHLAMGDEFTDPVFGGLSVQFGGEVPTLDSDSRGEIIIETDNNQYAYVTFDSARSGTAGAYRLTYVYDNSTAATTVQPLMAYQSITATDKGRIHVYEGENIRESDYVIINQGDAGTILEVETIDYDTSDLTGTIDLTDVITGSTQKVTVNNASSRIYKSSINFFGGNGYAIDSNSAGTIVNITWGSGTRTLFPRIKLKDGGWLALLQQTAIANGTTIIFPDGLTTLDTTGTATISDDVIARAGSYTVNGINWTTAITANSTTETIVGLANPACNFSSALGPAVLFIEPKKWDDASYGNYICTPMSTSGTTEIAIGDPVMNGTNSGFVTLSSDTYQKEAVDQYGTLITKEDRTNENGVATISYPTSQMYLDVLFTAEGVTVIPGSGGSSTSKDLGDVTVYDSQFSQVSSKNVIVVGGSCINTVAATLLGGAYCGADFTANTDIADGQFLIESFDNTDADGDEVALLVAGYEAADTVNAIKYLTTEDVDTTVGNKYKGTDASTASLVTE